MLLTALFLAAQIFAPMSMFSATPGLPAPGSHLADQDEWGVGHLIMDGHDGARISVPPNAAGHANVDIIEVIMFGDTIESHGYAVLLYENGHRVYPVREVFADGERLTFFTEKFPGVNAELHVRFRIVTGQQDGILYVAMSNATGNQVSGRWVFLATDNVNSPYRPTRQIGEGSVRDVLIIPASGRLLDYRTIPPARSTAPPVTTPDPTPAPTATPQPTPEVTGNSEEGANVNLPILYTTHPVIQNLVGVSSWAEAGVRDAISRGLVPQHLQSNFTQPITRAEFSALAVALYESINGEIIGRVTFSDTTDVNVEKAASIGIVSGVGNNRFNPNGTLSREQAAVMMARLSAAIGNPLPNAAPTFADNDSISSWAVDNVGRIQAAGIMGGVGNNRFAPQSPFTREQSIATILRLLR